MNIFRSRDDHPDDGDDFGQRAAATAKDYRAAVSAESGPALAKLRAAEAALASLRAAAGTAPTAAQRVEIAHAEVEVEQRQHRVESIDAELRRASATSDEHLALERGAQRPGEPGAALQVVVRR